MLGRIDEGDGVGRIYTGGFGFALELGFVGVGETCELGFVLYEDEGVAHGFGEGVAELLFEDGDACVNLLKLFLLVVGQCRTTTGERLVDLFEHLFVLALEGGVLVVVDGLDLIEEVLVEGHFVVPSREKRHHLCLDVFDLLGGIRAGYGKERSRGTGE